MKKLFSLVFLFSAFVFTANAQDITGKWKTIDDETGEAKSYVTISKKGDTYYGKVTTILSKDKQDAVCDECKDYRKDQPIKGMTIFSDIEKVSDDKYTGGKILDPNKGKEYDLTIIPSGDNELIIKGGYKIFGKMVGRTQKWYRVNE